MSTIERIEELQKIIQQLSLSQQDAEKILAAEPLFVKKRTKKHGFTVSIAAITDSAILRITEKLNELRNFGDITLTDNAMARVITIYGVEEEDLPKLETIIKKFKREG